MTLSGDGRFMDSKRLRIVSIDKELLICLLQNAHKEWTFSGMPDDAELVGSRDRFDKNTVELKVWSKEFSPVNEGCLIPELLIYSIRNKS